MNFLALRAFLAAFLIGSSMLSGVAETPSRKIPPAWYRGLNLSAPVNPRFEPLQIVGIECEDGTHVVGEFVYIYRKEGDANTPPLTINGSRKPDGTFWPKVAAYTSNEINSQWTTIGEPLTPGESISLVVTSKEEKQQFYVDLDVFRPMIGKMKYGKVILETGDSTIFEIEDLSPP
jgi:hypothetical protein